jgi:hypothetical protein
MKNHQMSRSRTENLNEAIDSILAQHNITGAFDPDWLTDQLIIRGVEPSIMSKRAALRKELTGAMRVQKFKYKGVYNVRKKLSVTHKLADGTNMSLWADSETANPQFWETCLRQKWESLANRGFQLYSDLTYYNNEKNPGEAFQLQFDLRDENADREQRQNKDGGDVDYDDED